MGAMREAVVVFNVLRSLQVTGRFCGGVVAAWAKRGTENGERENGKANVLM